MILNKIRQGAVIALIALSTLSLSEAQNAPPEFFGTIGRYAPSDFYVTDLAFDPNGDVFLANLLRDSIDKYSPEYLFRKIYP